MLLYSLITNYKSFIRPHLVYVTAICDQPNNDSFTDKIEQLRYKACVVITRAIQGTSLKCLYNELELESVSSRKWCRNLCAIYKLLPTQCRKCLFDILPSSENFYDTRKKQKPFFNCRPDLYRNGCNLSQNTRNIKLESYCSFQKQTSLLQDSAKDLYLMSMTVKVLDSWQDYVFVFAT